MIPSLIIIINYDLFTEKVAEHNVTVRYDEEA